MKKLLAVAAGIMLVCLLLSIALAGGKKDSQIQPADQNSDQVVDQSAGASESSVSQDQIDTVKKREAARAQRDKKLKMRARNVQKSPVGNDNLFRSSR